MEQYNNALLAMGETLKKLNRVVKVTYRKRSGQWKQSYWTDKVLLVQIVPLQYRSSLETFMSEETEILSTQNVSRDDAKK